MALEKVKTILKLAEEANTAVIAYICIDYNMAYSAITVAEELQKPVIIMLLPEHQTVNNVMGVAGFAQMVRELAEQVKVPVGLHLDHCSDLGYIARAIAGGFNSVMIDGSALPLEENIAVTKRAAELAHALDADVEAELGHVGLAREDAQEQEDLFTKPEIAARFCQETQVDALTVAVGSAHGAYKKPPRLDIERLEAINHATETPLVLHGGSGIGNDQLEMAFTKGINKLNVGTEYLEYYYKSMEEYVDRNRDNGKELRMLGFPQFVQGRLMEYLREKMKLSVF